MLLSETHLTDRYNFEIQGYTFYSTHHPDGRAHGGTGILIRRRIRHDVLNGFSTEYLQATSIRIYDQSAPLTLSAIYCPPRFAVKSEQFMDFFNTLGGHFLAAGDYNAKHTHWGSRLISPRGRQLYSCLMQRHGLDFVSTGVPTYWPSDRNKIPDLIDFGIFKGIVKARLTAASSYDLSSDHSPIIISLRVGLMPADRPHGFPLKRTNWLKYRKYVSTHIGTIDFPIMGSSDIDAALQEINSIMKQGEQHSTSVQMVSDARNGSYTNRETEILVREKRRCRREWQERRSPGAKLMFNNALARLRIALEKDKRRSDDKFVENKSGSKLFSATH